jgi:hypothetical protein
LNAERLLEQIKKKIDGRVISINDLVFDFKDQVINNCERLFFSFKTNKLIALIHELLKSDREVDLYILAFLAGIFCPRDFPRLK